MGVILAVAGILVLFIVKGRSWLLNTNQHNSIEHMSEVKKQVTLDDESNRRLLQMYNDNKKRIPLIDTVADDLYEVWGDDWLDEHLPNQTNTTKVLPSILFFVVSKKGKLIFCDNLKGLPSTFGIHPNRIYDKLIGEGSEARGATKFNSMDVEYIKDKDEADIAFKAWGKIDENLRKFYPKEGIVIVNGSYNGSFLNVTWNIYKSVCEEPISSSAAKSSWKFAQNNYPYMKELKTQNDEDSFFKMFPELKDV